MLNTKKRGAAMIMVVCYVAVATVLSLSLLLISSVIITSVRTERDREQSRILAVSLSKELEAQLTRPSFDSAADELESADDSLWFYIKEAISSRKWPYYNEDERGHTARSAFKTLTFDPDSLSDDVLAAYPDIDKIEILMYWEYASDIETLDGVPLTIAVTSVYGTSTCTVTSTYSLSLSSVTDSSGSSYEKWVWSLSWRE